MQERRSPKHTHGIPSPFGTCNARQQTASPRHRRSAMPVSSLILLACLPKLVAFSLPSSVDMLDSLDENRDLRRLATSCSTSCDLVLAGCDSDCNSGCTESCSADQCGAVTCASDSTTESNTCASCPSSRPALPPPTPPLDRQSPWWAWLILGLGLAIVFMICFCLWKYCCHNFTTCCDIWHGCSSGSSASV